MTQISDKILDRIKNEKIQPAPRWRFLATNWMLLGSFVVVMSMGVISIGLILDLTVGNDWDLYPYLHKSFFEYVLFSLPYLWIISLAFFSWVAYYNFTHIKGWYRHKIYKVIAACVGLSVALGIFCYYFGIGSFIDDTFASNIPYYTLLNKATKKGVWDHPEEGLLGGKITNLKEDMSQFELADSDGHKWTVINKTEASKDVQIEIGEKVKIIGKQQDDDSFIASGIRTWDPHEFHRVGPTKSGDPSGICTKPEVPCQ